MPMPDTQKPELRTDTIEQLIDLLEAPDLGRAGQIMPRDRRRAVADRLKQQTSKPDAVGLCGLPGAGKGYTSEKLSTVYGVPVVSMGDAIRQEYKERNWRGKMESEVPDEIPSDKLGDFAAKWRDKNAEAIPEKVTEIASNLSELADSVEDEYERFIIDGVRSTTDYEVLSDYFDDFYLIEVTAGFETRLERLQDRGREGEEDFNRVDLAERDLNELENLGYSDLLDGDAVDITLSNGKRDIFTNNLARIVENNLPFDIEDGRPLGLDDELEQFRKGMPSGD